MFDETGSYVRNRPRKQLYREEGQMGISRRRRWRMAAILAMVVCMSGSAMAYAAEPVYPEEELSTDNGDPQTFTMPVIVSATDHSSKDDGVGENDDKDGDQGNDGDSSDNGGGSVAPSSGESTSQPGGDASQQTCLVKVTDCFKNKAGEDLFISVRSIGKYRKGTVLMLTAAKVEGYDISGESRRSVTVDKDMEVVFTYIENGSAVKTKQTTKSAGDADKNTSGDKAGKDSASEESVSENETVDGGAERETGDTGDEDDEENRRTPVIRKQQEEPEEEDTEAEEEPEVPQEPEKERFHMPWWGWLLIFFVPIAVTIIILAVTGKLSRLWLLIQSRFFHDQWQAWHGILTIQENRFLETIHAGEESGELLQSLIDAGGTPMDVLARATESGDMTYLPPGTKISVSYQNGGEYPEVRRLGAEEEAFYELLQGLTGKGEVIATFYNDPVELEFALTFQV